MLASLKEIGKYVDISDLTPEIIADKLTKSGIEVEEILYSSKATNLVNGKIIEIYPHPDSDHLHICKVDIKTEILDIVCGAPNARKGLKVIVAKVGAKLPGGEIKESKIRGATSFGMICSLAELGVDKKYLTDYQINGIEELKDDAVIGDENVLEYLGLDDVILNIKLLANRSDCLSIFNISREIGALFGKNVEIPKYEYPNLKSCDFKLGSTTDKCKIFKGRLFKGVKIQDSPKEIKQFLQSEGIRSIDNIVDIGNVAMLLTGQAVHMYDYDKLAKRELIVRDDFEGDVVALDENTYHLNKGDLVVTSDGKPVCIAGINGLQSVKVDENTKNIVLEVASFYGASIRKTSTRLGLSSDSSLRYVKGIDTFNMDFVVDYITHLFEKYLNVESIEKIEGYDVSNRTKTVINCSVNYINNRLGTNLDYKTIKDILEKLYFVIDDVDGNEFVAHVPTFRIDITTKACISEEIIRYIGFDLIKSELPVMETTTGKLNDDETKSNVIKDYLLNIGLNEILTYTLLSKKENESFNFLNTDEPYVILNPLTEDHEIVRRNLLSSMIKSVEYNLSHLNRNFGLFEISSVESKNVREKHLSIALSGEKLGIDLYKAKKYDVLDLKGIVFNILNMFNISSSRIKIERLTESKELHPYRSFKLYLDNKLLGVIGEIYPTLKEHFNFNKDALVVGEINLTRLFNTKTAAIKAKEYSKFPSVSRDYAFVVKNDVEYGTIYKEIKKISNLIENIELFDLYKGENIIKDFVSIALTITFTKIDSTFSNDEINALDAKVRDCIKTKIGGILRS